MEKLHKSQFNGITRAIAWLLILVFVANFLGAFLAPKKARAADPNMMLFWDTALGGVGPPAGWSFVDDGAGEAFYNDGVKNLFPRGEASFSRLAGGAATHTHTATATSPSADQSGGTSRKATNSAGTVTRYSHTHAVSGSASLTSISNNPAYRNLRVIQYSGIPTTIPQYAIAIYDSTVADQMPNASWTSYSATQSTNYVSGFSASGGTGGSNSHGAAGHVISGLTLDNNGSPSTINGTTGSRNTLVHSHTACSTGNTTSNPSSEPPYVNVLLGYANTNTSVPAHMIAMFDNSSFTSFGWETLSGVGGPFYQKFLKSATTYSAGAGADPTHSHVAVTCTSSSVTGNQAGGSGTNDLGISGSHTHTTTVTINAAMATTLPEYTNVVFAKKSYVFTSLSTDKGTYHANGETITVNAAVDNHSTSNLANTKIIYIIFEDTDADNFPDVGEKMVNSDCAGSANIVNNVLTDFTEYTWQKTGLNVNAETQGTDQQSCANTNFPDHTDYVLWAKWYDTGGTLIYDTKYVGFHSVPTLTEILFMTLVGCTVFMGINSGVIKVKRNKKTGSKDIKDSSKDKIDSGNSHQGRGITYQNGMEMRHLIMPNQRSIDGITRKDNFNK